MATWLGKIDGSDDGDAVLHDGFAGSVSSQLPPCSAARSTMTDPGFMAFDHFLR